MEQSFSKADRCFHEGRFGPKSEDTERRSVMLLCMDTLWDQDVIAAARRLYAGAVRRHIGKYKSRMDKGIAKGRYPTSEANFLKRKRDSVREAAAGPRESILQGNAAQLSAKAVKEMQLQKKRRMTRAIEAAEHGYLLPDDVEAPEAVSKLADKRRNDFQKDTKRIENMAARKKLCETTCEAQSWNWKSLGPQKAWTASPLPAQTLSPLVSVTESWPDIQKLIFQHLL